MDSGKFIINQGHVTGQCIGDNQSITMSFENETMVSTTHNTTQIKTSFFTLSQEIQKELPADKYNQMSKEIQDVIDKYRRQ